MKVFATNTWIPRIKYGAGLLEFTPAKAGAGMTTRQHRAKSAMGNKGFTLIEIIVLIVMAGILLPAIIVPFATGVKGSGKPEMATTAMYLAHQKMEEFMKFDYGKTPELDPTSPISLQNSPISGYQWGYEILYVTSSDLMTGSVNPPDTNYKRIRVQVTDPESSTYEVYSVVTNFP